MHRILHLSLALLSLQQLGLLRKAYLNFNCPIGHRLGALDNVMRTIAVARINLHYLLLLNVIFEHSVAADESACFIGLYSHLSLTKR